MAEMSFYYCEICGNLVYVVEDGGGPLVCCGEDMTKLEPNTVDASHEKHVPVVTKKDGMLRVDVGSTPHPMLPEHHIEWIVLAADNRVEFKRLEPGLEPAAEFADAMTGVVYAYCNIHGLWETKF